MREMFNILIICALCLAALPGCTRQTAPEGKPVPQLTYAHLAPWPVRTAGYRVVDRVVPADTVPDYVRAFPTHPRNALRAYAQQRIRAAGTGPPDSALVFSIDDVRIGHEPEPAGNPVLRFTGFGGAAHYTLEIEISLEHMPGGGGPRSVSTHHFMHRIRVPAHFSLAERDRALSGFVDKAIGEVDDAVRLALAEKFRILNVSRTPGRTEPAR